VQLPPTDFGSFSCHRFPLLPSPLLGRASLSVHAWSRDPHRCSSAPPHPARSADPEELTVPDSIQIQQSRTMTAALRAGQLPVPVGERIRTSRNAANTRAAAFEADLLRLGFILDDEARARVLELSDARLTVFHGEVLPAAKALVGDAVHRHLFLQFPEIDVDDHAYLSWRVWTWARSVAAQQDKTLDADLRLLEPCLHLIYAEALQGHGACPVCQVPVQKVGGEMFAAPEHLPAEALSPLRLLRGNPAELALSELLVSRLQSTAPAAEHELAELRAAVHDADAAPDLTHDSSTNALIRRYRAGRGRN